MNITNILKTLCEASEVSKIKASVGDKVPASVMDALAKNAKQTQRGAFYDNEAMAIIKSVSGGNDDPYLLANPNAVHSILKKLKKGDSSFKADEILDGGSGKDYWKDLYKKSNEDKPKLTKAEKDYNTTGLNTAVVKSIDDDWFAILPKNFYDTKRAEKELKVIDIKKSHEDIKRISAEIAAKDSGKEKGSGLVWGNDRNRGDKTNPKVNHWCVSSSGSNYYENYSNSGIYKFIIFVKKNPDGSPNWDKRYLWYYNGHGEEEFADKWDKHTNIVLSYKAKKFTNSIKSSVVKSGMKKTMFINTIKDAAKKKAHKDLGEIDKNSREYDISVDGEIENMLKGAKRKNITKKKEAEVIVKNMPWLEEANKLKAAELKKYFENKASYVIQQRDNPILIYTDNYKNGVAVVNTYNGQRVLIFNGDEPLAPSLFELYGTNFNSLARMTNSVVYYENSIHTYKQLLDFLRAIVGTGKIKFEPKRLSGYRPDASDRKPLSTIHVKVLATPEKTVMKNLSEFGQELFDSAYKSVFPTREVVEFRNHGGGTEKFFYNSELKTLFAITYDSSNKGYKVLYKSSNGDNWTVLTKIDDDNLDKAKKAIKEFQDKRRAEIEGQKRIVAAKRTEIEQNEHN